MTLEARRLTVKGTVQGVGFRPFVHRLAHSLGVLGRVFNAPEGLVIEVESSARALDSFQAQLQAAAPTRAAIRQLQVAPMEPAGAADFQIVSSRADGLADGLPPPDIATCGQCLAELRDPADPRHGYPFVNCTDCGPRFSILRGLPYDRRSTSMAEFPLCRRCSAEYADPSSRRFHAQPNACPRCGPRVWLADARGKQIRSASAVQEAARLLAEGRIGGVQGLGGFHLACDARRVEAITRLRLGKHRPDKPLAVMVRDIASAREIARVSEEEEALLRSWRAPIVLLRPLPGSLPEQVRGRSGFLGVMLPYTPLHHLLLSGRCRTLVMTSGNTSGAPMARTHGEARSALSHLVDFFLLHDRPIERRVDDSVVRLAGRHRILLRRGRGWAGEAVELPAQGPEVLALGGDLKTTVAVTKGSVAVLSQHLGDLSHPDTLEIHRHAAGDLCRLLSLSPAVLAHDLHPDFHSTRLAQELGQEHGCQLLAVQHHHAHALACLAEHRFKGPALALVLDGAGLGPDGSVWGGELLQVDGLRWRRLAQLAPLPLPGGDRAASEPWRMAAALTTSLDPERAGRRLRDLVSPKQVPADVLQGVLSLCSAQTTTITSSAGRLFDAVASLLDLCQVSTFEAQGAMALEAAAEGSQTQDCLEHRLLPSDGDGPLLIDITPDLLPLTDRARASGDIAQAARIFHNTLVEALVRATLVARRRTGLRTVALSGGVLQNAIISTGISGRLAAEGFDVLQHRLVPPGDGGLSLGQAWAGVLAAGG